MHIHHQIPYNVLQSVNRQPRKSFTFMLCFTLLTAVCSLRCHLNSKVWTCRGSRERLQTSCLRNHRVCLLCQRECWKSRTAEMFSFKSVGTAQQGRLNHSSDTKNKILHWCKLFIFISYHIFTMYQAQRVKTPSNMQQQLTTPASQSKSFKSCQDTGPSLAQSRLLDC